MSTGDVKDFFTHILQRGKDAFQNAASKIHINGENVSNGDYALVVSQTGQSRHMTYEDFKLFLSDPIVKQVISGFVGLGLSAVLVYLVHRWIDPTSKDKTDAKTKVNTFNFKASSENIHKHRLRMCPKCITVRVWLGDAVRTYF